MPTELYNNWKTTDDGGFHTVDDEAFKMALSYWGIFNKIRDVYKIVDFACGDATAGMILSKNYKNLIYHGFDNNPNIVDEANKKLHEYPKATAFLHDNINDKINEIYNAAIDSNFLYLLHDKKERVIYLRYAYNCLEIGSPMLFFVQSTDSSGLKEIKADYESDILTAGFIIPENENPKGEHINTFSVWAYKL